MTSPAEAGPSRRAPVRSLRQPTLLKVATRNDAGGLEPPSRSDAVDLRLAMERKVQWRRKGERWMDRLCEGTVSPEEFKRGAKYLEHHQFLETLHERHLNSHCSYPLCHNPPAAPYSSKPRWAISLKKRDLEQKEGNPEQGYCSKVCRVRSGYVEEQMREGSGVRGEKWRVELLEGTEMKSGRPPERGGSGTVAQSKAGDGVPPALAMEASNGRVPSMLPPSSDDAEKPIRPQIDHMVQIGSATPSSSTPDPKAAASSQSPQTKRQPAPRVASPQPPPARRPPPKIAPPPLPPNPQAREKLDQLLANLTIVERATVPPPGPDTPDAPIHVSAAAPSPTKPGNNDLTSGPASARASSSLIATPNKLASTLISASRLSGPVPQLDADSDEESQLSDWEIEMDGFSGLGEEEKALFEEMRLARELADAEGGT